MEAFCHPRLVKPSHSADKPVRQQPNIEDIGPILFLVAAE
jgi:hypothetical protein